MRCRFLADCEDLWVEIKPFVSLCDCFAPVSSLILGFAGEWLPTGKVTKGLSLFCGVCNLVIGISLTQGFLQARVS